MTIDVLGIRDQTLANVAEVYSNLTLPEGIGIFVGVAALTGAVWWHRRWVKGKGYRMACDVERRRIKDLLTEGLNDLILQYEVDGKISIKQGDLLYKQLADRLDLPDLIPRQRRVKIIKQEIKARLKSPNHQIKKPSVPGKPEPNFPVKFREVIGNVSKFFTKAA